MAWTAGVRRRTVIMCVALAVLLGALCIRTWVRATQQDRSRIERKHGLRLPASAGGFRCGGDALVGFLDRGASSVFEMDAADLELLIAQFWTLQLTGASFDLQTGTKAGALRTFTRYATHSSRISPTPACTPAWGRIWRATATST